VRMFYNLFLVFMLLGLLSACSKVSDETVIQAREAVNKGGVIVDVRTPSEFNVRHVTGAVNIPLQSLTKDYVRLSKEKPVIVYCRSGNRSATATKFLTQKGYTVYDVATQSDWERKISPTL